MKPFSVELLWGQQQGHVSKYEPYRSAASTFPTTFVRHISSASTKVVLVISSKLLAKHARVFFRLEVAIRHWIATRSTLGRRCSSFCPFWQFHLFEVLRVCHHIIYLILVLRIFHQEQGSYALFWGRQPNYFPGQYSESAKSRGQFPLSDLCHHTCVSSDTGRPLCQSKTCAVNSLTVGVFGFSALTLFVTNNMKRLGSTSTPSVVLWTCACPTGTRSWGGSHICHIVQIMKM